MFCNYFKVINLRFKNLKIPFISLSNTSSFLSSFANRLSLLNSYYITSYQDSNSYFFYFCILYPLNGIFYKNLQIITYNTILLFISLNSLSFFSSFLTIKCFLERCLNSSSFPCVISSSLFFSKSFQIPIISCLYLIHLLFSFILWIYNLFLYFLCPSDIILFFLDFNWWLLESFFINFHLFLHVFICSL